MKGQVSICNATQQLGVSWSESTMLQPSCLLLHLAAHQIVHGPTNNKCSAGLCQ